MAENEEKIKYIGPFISERLKYIKNKSTIFKGNIRSPNSKFSDRNFVNTTDKLINNEKSPVLKKLISFNSEIKLPIPTPLKMNNKYQISNHKLNIFDNLLNSKDSVNNKINNFENNQGTNLTLPPIKTRQLYKNIYNSKHINF